MNYPNFDAISLLKKQCEKGHQLLMNVPVSCEQKQAWDVGVEHAVISAFGPSSPYLTRITNSARFVSIYPDEQENAKRRATNVHTIIQILEQLIDSLADQLALCIGTPVDRDYADSAVSQASAAEDYQTIEEGYDTAQVCVDGHMVNAEYRMSPQFNKSFCPECGELTITECPSCNAFIQGYYHVPGVHTSADPPKSYCHNCGKAYPWTERKIRASIELFVEETMPTDEEKQQFTEIVSQLIRNSSGAPLAASRLARSLSKWTPLAVSAMRDILINVISQPLANKIFPQ